MLKTHGKQIQIQCELIKTGSSWGKVPGVQKLEAFVRLLCNFAQSSHVLCSVLQPLQILQLKKVCELYLWFFLGPKSIIKCSWKRFVNSIYDWITSLYIDPRKGLLLLASWHFKRKLSRTAKNCFQINLRHTLLLLLCEGADDVWRLGEHVLRNLPHNIRHCVKVADHLDRWLRHIRFCYVFFFQNFMFPMFSHSICQCVKIADHLDRSCSISTPLISAYTFR